MTGWDREYTENREEYHKLFDRVLTQKQDADLGFLEQNICQKTNRKHAISVSSGTDALFFSLLALDIKSGDEVLVSDFSWISSASCVSMVNAIPVFCDIDIDSYHISLDSIKRMLSPKTKAIIYPFLFGNMSNIQSILNFCKENDIHFIEDACQAIGASYKNIKAGSSGIISTLSFNANKNIAGIAGGGAVLTDDEEIAEKIKKIRVHGKGEMLGYNSKMLLLNAEIINHRLRSIEKWQKDRRVLANLYNLKFSTLSGISYQFDPHVNHSYHKYVVKFMNKATRDVIQKALKASIHYERPLSENSMYACLPHKKDICTVSKTVCDTILTLPLTHYSTEEEIHSTLETIWNYI